MERECSRRGIGGRLRPRRKPDLVEGRAPAVTPDRRLPRAAQGTEHTPFYFHDNKLLDENRMH